MFTNTTTWEMASRERITYLHKLDYEENPFHEGYLQNSLRFLCACKPRDWHMIYNKHVLTSSSENSEASLEASVHIEIDGNAVTVKEETV